jgi:acyl carrier protein
MMIIERRTASEIKRWLTAYIARERNVPESKIDPIRRLEAYGLDSVTVAVMTGDLEEWLGVSVEATLPYKYPTIEQLSIALATA